MSMDSFYCVNTESLEEIFIEWAVPIILCRAVRWWGAV
jgi:hypothetical protein